jgi:putative PIG3 family NAD(P)H quinone oxidoreductase
VKAIVIPRFGGPEVLELRDVPTPAPARGEVAVRVAATAVNRADLLQRLGAYPAPADAPPDIPGIEFAGTVEALGPGVEGWKLGDRVFGLAGGGTYAETVVVHARTLARVPDGLGLREAAAVPEAFITAHDALVGQAGFAAGETVLVTACGSGVGTAALQLVRALGGTALGTARSRAKLERARIFGLEHGVVPEDGHYAAAVRAATAGRGVDVVLELVGGPYLAEDVACAAPRGRIVLVGLVAGVRAELDLRAVLNQRLSITGTVLRSRPLEEKIAVAQSFARHVVPLITRGALLPVVDRVFPLAEAGAAHEHMASNESFGKVVLEVAA